MKIASIGIGRSEVFKDRDLQIKIVLGSCVGLVLYDEKIGVCGAIHILLPKFKQVKQGAPLTAYADTGIEHLISLMREYTGDINNYKAVLAGGADLAGGEFFNIGEENYKVTKKMLQKYSIEVVFENCLGDKAKVLNFFTKDFSHNVTEISKDVDLGNIELEYEFSYILKEIKSHEKYLPVPSKSILEIVKLREDEISIEKIEEIILKDDSLCVNFLRFVNSAYMSPRYKINDIRRAISYVGMNNLFKFVNNLFMQNLVKNDLQSYSLNMYEYKIHSLAVAILSEIIAESVGEEHQIAYLGGLFHDLGKVILDKFAMENFTSSKRAQIISFVESSIQSSAHAIIGVFYLKTLNLDNRILSIVEHHHFPSQANHNKKLVCSVALANMLISMFMLGMDRFQRKITINSVQEIIEMLDIDRQTMDSIMQTIPYVIASAEEMVI
ncbi:MAG: HDOD domain-containing protein [Desulfonauticus sp.]|nr:HDOD domain-containing protein [Desulfonauticus sp.]